MIHKNFQSGEYLYILIKYYINFIFHGKPLGIKEYYP